MNYLGWLGYNFYNAANSTERASLFSSWGLMSSAPGYTPPARRIVDWFWEFFS